MATLTLWTKITLKIINHVIYGLSVFITQIYILFQSNNYVLTTGPLAPGPASVPMGPFETEVLRLEHQSSALSFVLMFSTVIN